MKSYLEILPGAVRARAKLLLVFYCYHFDYHTAQHDVVFWGSFSPGCRTKQAIKVNSLLCIHFIFVFFFFLLLFFVCFPVVSFVFLAAVNWTRLYPHHIRRLTSSNFTISHHFWHFSSTDYFSDSLWLFCWSSIHGCIDKTTSQLMNRWCHLNRANSILM